MSGVPFLFFVVRRRKGLFSLAGCLLLTCLCLTACSEASGSSTPTATPTPSNVALSKLHWCGQPLMIFRDEHASATATPGSTPTATATATPTGPTTVTDWAEVKPNLGFTVYLPATLPAGSCLVSASGTFHDPIFGGSFTIGYLLPDHKSISLSEAPLGTKKLDFQCNPASSATVQAPGGSKAATPTATASAGLLCNGARDNTNIVFSAPGDTTALQKFFDGLSPDVEWVPAK